MTVEYRCPECKTVYEMFYKNEKEVEDWIICHKCSEVTPEDLDKGIVKAKKQISAPGLNLSGLQNHQF